MAIRKTTQEKYMDALLLLQNERIGFKTLNEFGNFFNVGRPFGYALRDLKLLEVIEGKHYFKGRVNKNLPSKISDVMNSKNYQSKQKTLRNVVVKQPQQMIIPSEKKHARGFELSILWGLVSFKK